jgi:molecular chaperone HscB
MIDFSRNHFELFGLPVRYALDGGSLERSYRALQSEVPPDRYAGGDETEQRLALQSSARVNEAYEALRSPVGRAQYLLSLHGVDALSGARGALSLDFLERQLERRESAAQATEARDVAALEALLAEVRAERAAIESALAVLLDRDQAWVAASAQVRELTFLGKLAADVDAMLGELESDS